MEHVKAQNWVAVGLDLAVVVLGVFIGFQVDRFYESARERSEERNYLYRLHSDISQSLDATGETKAFVDRNTRYGDIILSSLDRCELDDKDRDDFATGLYHLGKHVPTTFVRGTFDELLAAGRFGLIRNPEIRDSLTETARQLESQDKIWPKIHGRLNEHHGYMDQRFRFRFRERPGAIDDIKWENLIIDFEALCKDEVFKVGMSTMQQMSYITLDWYDWNLDNFARTKAALEQELEPEIGGPE